MSVPALQEIAKSEFACEKRVTRSAEKRIACIKRVAEVGSKFISEIAENGITFETQFAENGNPCVTAG